MHCWWNNFKCIGESNYKKWGAIIWIDFGIACDCHNTLINSNEASNCRAVSLELDSSFFIVSTTIILNSGVYLLFDFLFSIKRPLSLDFKSIYLCYTTLSNKGAHFKLGCSFVHSDFIRKLQSFLFEFFAVVQLSPSSDLFYYFYSIRFLGEWQLCFYYNIPKRLTLNWTKRFFVIVVYSVLYSIWFYF